MMDHCTGWFEGLWGLDWSHCCAVHDIQYELGFPRLPADIALGRCVARAGAPLIGAIMTLATAAFGWLFWRGRRR